MKLFKTKCKDTVHAYTFGCFFVSSAVKERKTKFLQTFILKKKISRPISFDQFVSMEEREIDIICHGLFYL